MKKKLIISFLLKEGIKKFLKKSEPSAIAYEMYIKNNPKVSYGYFTTVFNDVQIKLNNLPKMSVENLNKIINQFPRKHSHGFIDFEIKVLLKMYNIDLKKFKNKFGINTAEIIDGEIVNYNCDVMKTLLCILENRNETVLEFD